MAKVWIGTTGYGYQEWKGKFYPSDLPDQEMLAYYAQRFPSVELNQTSYRMPNVRTLHRIGRCYLKLNRHAEAVAVLRRAVRLDPNNEELRQDYQRASKAGRK